MAGISLILQNNPNVTAINCGTSSPRLGGTIDISAFPSLTGFTCRNNDITNISGYGANTVLEVFDCQDNAFAGTNIFETLSNKPNLRIFNWSAVRSNQYPNLLGTFPDFSANTKLELLYLNNTALSGSNISFSALSSLQLLAVQNNRLSGPLPPLFTGIVNNPALREVNLGGNVAGITKFTGALHDLSKFPNLTLYAVNRNALTGSIPNLSGATSLGRLYIFNNQLTGPIPSLSGLTQLREFRCEINQLTGTIPTLSGLTNLQDFYVHTNQLTGPIPSLTGLNNLNRAWFSTNNFTGAIPSITGLTQLLTFTCFTNQLTGSIPNLDGLNLLQVFLCHNQTGATKLTGAIPSLSNVPILRQFWCHTNQLTGFAGGSVSNTLGDFQAQNNQLTSTAVNAILAAFVAAGRTSANGTCILNLGGTGNAAPIGQGLTDKATLISRGWTVTTN